MTVRPLPLSLLTAIALSASGCTCWEDENACVVEGALPSEDTCTPVFETVCFDDTDEPPPLRTCSARHDSETCADLGFSACGDGTWRRYATHCG